MLGPAIGVKAIRQAIANGEDVSTRSAGRLENRDLVPVLQEFVGATKSADSSSGDDYFLRAAGLRVGR